MYAKFNKIFTRNDNQQMGYVPWAFIIASVVLLVLSAGLFWHTNQLASDIDQQLAFLRQQEPVPDDTEALLNEMRGIEESIRRSEQSASELLGFFEVMGVAITVLGVIVAVLGVAGGINFGNALSRLEEARRKYEVQVTEFENTLERRYSDLREEVEEIGSRTSRSLSLLPLAQRRFKSGDLKGALGLYRRAANLDERNPIPYYYIGYILTQKNQLDAAKAEFEKSLTIDPKLQEAQAALGFVYRRLGDEASSPQLQETYYDKAELLLLNALVESRALVDADGESWAGSLAGLYKRRGNIPQAMRYYELAKDVTPQSSYPVVNLALLSLENENFEAIQANFSQVKSLAENEIRAELENYWAHADKLTATVALNRREEAEDTMKAFVDLTPSDAKDVFPRVIDTLERIRTTYTKLDKDLSTIDWALNKLREANSATLNDDAAPESTD